MDEERELERVERDLAAIELRRMAPGYTSSLPTAVLDEERALVVELEKQRSALMAHIASRPPLPEGGTLSSPQAGTWGVLPMGPVAASATPAFGVTTVAKTPKREWAQLEAEVERLLKRDWEGRDFQAVRERLGDLAKDWDGDLPALQLIAAAGRHVGLRHFPIKLDQASEPNPAPLIDLAPRLLVEGAEPIDVLTGLNDLQLRVLKAVVAAAPPDGRFVRVSEVAAEVVGAAVAATDVERALIVMGHPVLRALPLVELQGLNRLERDAPTVTGARSTMVGRDVARGEPPLPMLLVNGAAAGGRWIPPSELRNVLRFCVGLAKNAIDGKHAEPEPRAFSSALGEGSRGGSHSATRHHSWLPHPEQVRRLRARLDVTFEPGRTPIVVHPPWPLTFDEARVRIEPELGQGWLCGVTRVIDLSGAEGTRVGFEVRHPAFVRQTAIALERRQPFAVAIPANFHPVGYRGHVFQSVIEFLELRFHLAAARVRRGETEAAKRAEKEEAVRVAVAMLDRVQEVIRSADDDAAAIEALQTCFGDAQRAVLPTMEFPLSHSYERGFTRTQAEHLVKQRKLHQRTVAMARADWARALEGAQTAARTLATDAEVWELVLAELLELQQFPSGKTT